MIILQFVGGADWSSRLVRQFVSRHLCHVDVVMPDGGLLGARGDTVGGVAPGVRIRPANYLDLAKTDQRIRFALSYAATQEVAFFDFLQKQVGKPYDYEAILGFAFNRDWREPDSWICAELVTVALEKAKIIKPVYLASNRITPSACALMMSTLMPAAVYAT